jgi:hypothetical protein
LCICHTSTIVVNFRETWCTQQALAVGLSALINNYAGDKNIRKNGGSYER